MTIVEINHLQVTFAEKTAVSAASFRLMPERHLV